MTVNVEIQNNGSESNANVLRRFRKKIQESGVLNRVRSLRFEKRKQSTFNRKKSKLRKLSRQSEIEKLRKLGKIVSRSRSRR